MYYSIKKFIQLNKSQDCNEKLNNLHILLSKHKSFSLTYNYTEEESFIEKDLPIPTFIRYYQDQNFVHKCHLVWVIDGYFKKNKAKLFLKDIKTKLQTIYKTGRVDIFIPFSFINGDVYNNHLIKLNEFKDTQWKKENKFYKQQAKVNKLRENPLILGLQGKDKLFESARFEVYDLKKNGELTYENTFKIFEKYGKILNSSFSEIKGKAKNVFEWTKENYNPKNAKYYKEYYENTRKIKDNRMTQKTFLEKLAKEKVKATKEAIVNGIVLTLLENKKLTITNISLNSKVSRVTLNKPEYKEIIKLYQDKQKKQ